MSAANLRLFGMLCSLSAIVLMVLSLKSVAGLNTIWPALILLVLAFIFYLLAANKK